MTEVYYLFFCGTNRWFSKFLRKDFAHVIIYKKIIGETYVQLHSAWNLEVNILKDIKNSFQDVKKICNMKILKVEMNPDNVSERFMSFLFAGWGVYNCVLLAKYVLGLRSWCVTPYGLFKCFSRNLYRKKNKHLFNVEVI